jgi:hypothetical protein
MSVGPLVRSSVLVAVGLSATSAAARPPKPAKAPVVYAEPGDPLPPGTHLEERSRSGLVGAGIGTFAGCYLLPPLFLGLGAMAGKLACDKPDCKSDGPNVGKLFVPFAGPLLYHRDHPDESAFWWVVFTVGQVGGAALFTWAVNNPRHAVVPDETFTLAPVVAPPVGRSPGFVGVLLAAPLF